MKNISLIGSGHRVKSTIIPAILNSKQLKINQVISKQENKIITIKNEGINHKYKTIQLQDIKLENIHYIYIGITKNEINKVLSQLILNSLIKNIVLLIDTPPIYIKNILSIYKFKYFKNVYVIEDWPFFLTTKIYRHIINSNKLGKIKHAEFLHSSYEYHTLSLLRVLLNINFFTFMKKEKSYFGFSNIKIFNKFSLIAKIKEPLNNSIGQFLLFGSKGFLSNSYMISNKTNNNFYIKYIIYKNFFLGISLYQKNRKIEDFLLKDKIKLKSKDFNNEIYYILKTNAVNNIFWKLSKDKLKNIYTLKDAIYDYIACIALEKFGIFFDLPIPFTNSSIVNFLIYLIYNYKSSKKNF